MAEEIVVIAGEARKRSLRARGWEPGLVAGGEVGARLVSDPDGAVFVVEDGARRRVSSALLVPPLERALGRAEPISAAELSALSDGVPVEVLEAPSAPPFVVVGGQRRSVRGLPVPHAVSDVLVVSLPKGDTLDITRRPVPAPRPTPRPAPRPGPLGRLEASLRRRGPVGTLKRGVRAVERKARRAVRR